MNDIERYEYAEKILQMYKESEGTLDESKFVEVFGDVEPSKEDQELILKIVKDMIEHEHEIEEDTSSDEYQEDSDQTEGPE